MGLLLDTSVLITAERGGAALEELLGSREPCGISVITFAEYWKGVERAETEARRLARIEFYEGIAESLQVIDVDEEVASTAARLWARMEDKGRLIPALDLLIAATALAREWSLATADVKDFQRVEGLDVIEMPAPGAPAEG